MALETLSAQRCFGGVQGFYRHASEACGGSMQFGVYTPPQPGPRPVLFYLAGLTCSPETFAIKAGAQRIAAELGLVLVMPDTSPRDTGIEGATGDWEFGEAAGFYLDATQPPWSARFNMQRYLLDELLPEVAANFPVDLQRCGVFGHSMGGHGALTLALKNPSVFRSCSAFAPIVAPSQVPWGEKALSRYLGGDRAAWRAYDATALIEDGHRFDGELLIEQGLDDRFLIDQLKPELFESACAAARQGLRVRRHAGYDHSYWFIQSFVEDHLRHHAAVL
ncbi:MAG: S-formylglutathione hydrolase [Aquimonas sp.]|nr:S-formylglutathione hydrolase [Aquimonas sp.]